MKRIFDIIDFGAVPDGKTLNTLSIQKAVDECCASGGGSVIVSGGVFMTGTVILKDNVDLHIESDGVLLGSPSCGKYVDDPEHPGPHDLIAKAETCGDYPDFEKKHVIRDLLPRHRGCALIFAEECSNISITGNGAIDANGKSFIEKVPDGEHCWQPYRRIDAPTPPRVVFFTGCRNASVRDVTVRNQPAGWTFWIHDCDFVTFDRVKVLAEVDFPNNDGIHINSSRDVTISNSAVVCGDDSIIVRANNISLKENKVCERIVVNNCTLTSHSGGIRIGWVNDGVIRNCSFSNLVMTDTTKGVDICLPKLKSASSDHGREETLIENLSFSNIIMDSNYDVPIRIKIYDDPETRCRGIRNIFFSGIHARGFKLPDLAGTSRCHLDNISITNSSFEVLPAEQAADGRAHGATDYNPSVPAALKITNVDHLSLNNTSFKA